MHWAVVLLLSCMKAYSFGLWRSCHHVLCLSIYLIGASFLPSACCPDQISEKIRIVGEREIPYNSSNNMTQS